MTVVSLLYLHVCVKLYSQDYRTRSNLINVPVRSWCQFCDTEH